MIHCFDEEQKPSIFVVKASTQFRSLLLENEGFVYRLRAPLHRFGSSSLKVGFGVVSST